MPVVVPLRIPLLNGGKSSFADRLFKRKIDQTAPIVVTKPARRLGGAWMADKVGQRRVVCLCFSCVMKYRNWWKREHYRADWGWNYMGDCAGCGESNTKVTLFHAEEMFHKVLSNAHGKQPKPY